MPATDDSPERRGDVERAVMMVLLEGQLLSRVEVVREVAGSRDDESIVVDAIEALYAAGLLHIVDERFLLVTSAARRVDGLGL